MNYMLLIHIMIIIYIISKYFLTVEIWILNLKKWPLENQKNNGSIEKNSAREITSSVHVVYDPVHRIIFYRAVNENYMS